MSDTRLTEFLTELLTDRAVERYLSRVVAEAGGSAGSSAEAQLEGLGECSQAAAEGACVQAAMRMAWRHSQQSQYSQYSQHRYDSDRKGVMSGGALMKRVMMAGLVNGCAPSTAIGVWYAGQDKVLRKYSTS